MARSAVGRCQKEEVKAQEYTKEEREQRVLEEGLPSLFGVQCFDQVEDHVGPTPAFSYNSGRVSTGSM